MPPSDPTNPQHIVQTWIYNVWRLQQQQQLLLLTLMAYLGLLMCARKLIRLAAPPRSVRWAESVLSVW